MNKNTITTVFSEKEKVNIGYIVAGYPSVDFTKSFLSNLDRTAFLQKCEDVGISGLIIPDLPYEEAQELVEKLRARHIAFIPLVSVTSDKRIAPIASLGDGFVYAVGSLGVTGSKQVDLPRLQEFIAQVRSQTSLPVSLGFGIKTHADVEQMRQYADGVIVGTSIVALTSSNNLEETITQINELFK